MAGAEILKLLQGKDFKDVGQLLQAYLAPLLGTAGTRQEKNSKTDQRALAREYVPFLTQLFKICGGKLATVAAANDRAGQKLADEMFAAMTLAIDGLDVLRSQLAGSSFEIEWQRYALVRRLMNWKRYPSALAQSQLLLRSLCHATGIPEPTNNASAKGSSLRNSKKESSNRAAVSSGSNWFLSANLVLSPPSVSAPAGDLSTLIVPAAIDLIWCITENLEDSSWFRVAARLPGELAPWISVLESSTATKHRDALFKSIYKCTSILLLNPSKVEVDLLQQFCSLTLSLCASSSQSDQYTKVARKFCSSVALHSAESCTSGVKLCTEAIGQILSRNELRGARTSSDFSDLVDWFGRACQTDNEVELGWSQIYKVVDHVRKESPTAPVVLTGLWAIGLVLPRAEELQADREVADIGRKGDPKDLLYAKKQAWLPEGKNFYAKASELLKASLQLISVLLGKENSSSSKPTTKAPRMDSQTQTALGSVQSGDTSEVSKKTLVSFIRTLHYLQKPFTRYAQAMWSAYGGKSPHLEAQPRLFLSGLKNVLLMVDPVIKMSMRYSDLSDYENDILTKGTQLSAQGSVTALRLSLLFGDDLQDVSGHVSNMIDGLQTTEEQWWCVCSTYNMGAQLFNHNQYGLACWPFTLANKAAWARVKSSCSDHKIGISINDIIAEAAAKCLALVDAYNKIEEAEKSKAILVDGMLQWAEAKAEVPCIAVPQTLVKAFVKLNCSEKQISGGVRSLYSYLCDAPLVPHPRAMGLLLEEEHAACEALESNYGSVCLKLKDLVIEHLLDEVYTEENFVFQKSKMLMKKCRSLRLAGAGNVLNCFKIISDVVTLLEAAQEEREQITDGAWLELSQLERQLAIAYSLKAVCSYEINPFSEDFMQNVTMSLHNWRLLLQSNGKQGASLGTEVPSTADAEQQDSAVLLLHLIDLLAVQGHTGLALDVLNVAVEVIKSSKQLTEEWVELWMNGQRGHHLCAVPYSSSFLSAIRQTLDGNVNSTEFWESFFDRFPDSLLEFHYQSVRTDLCDEGLEDCRRLSNNLEVVDRMKGVIDARLLNSESQKASQFAIRTSGLCHFASELTFTNGNTLEALKYAKEAFQLRSRLYKFTFNGLQKRASNASSLETSASTADGQNFLQLRREFGISTIFSWPFSKKAEDYLNYPSQWRILGDYIESLMQMGVIYERMGAVDDAERKFREGHRLALAQNLQLALVSFSVNLGELNRKKQLWANAQKHFAEAKLTLDRIQTKATCERCISTGNALLQLRVGDLRRQCCSSQEKDTLENELRVAMTNYTEAAALLRPHLKHSQGEFDLQEERTFVASRSVHSAVLRSLQKKGKALCSEIMSYNVEGTQTSQITRRSRVKKTAQTRNSEIRITSAEQEITPVCDGMSLSSLSSTRLSTTDGNSGSGTEKSSRRAGLRSRVKKTQVSSENSALIVREAASDKTTITSTATQLDADNSGSREQLAQSNQKHRLSIEEWPACKLDRMGRKLLGRVLMQKGKCLARLGEPDEAMDTFNQAMHILNMKGLDEPISSDARLSLFPVEEGALLYHASRLSLRSRRECDELRSATKGSSLENSDVATSKLRNIGRLCRAFSLCQEVPLLIQKVAKLLALLHVPSTNEGTQYLSFSGMANAAAYFHQASLGMVTRLQHVAILNLKLEDRQIHDQQLKRCLERMREALRTAQVDTENLVAYAEDFWNRMPRCSACCISLVGKDDLEIVKGGFMRSSKGSSGITDGLLVTRLSFELKPVVVLLPILPILENPTKSQRGSNPGNSASDPYSLSSEEEDDCNSNVGNEALPADGDVNKIKETLLERVACEFKSILEESRISTSGVYPVSTMEDKSVWWKWRIELDARLSKMLRLVEDHWLGPFKCVLAGEVEASVTKSFELCTGFLVDMMSSVKHPSVSKSIDRNLANLLLQAVSSLTDSQLERIVAGMLMGFWENSFCEDHLNNCGSDCQTFGKKVDEEMYQHIKNISDSFLAAYKVATQESGYAALKTLADESSGKRRSRRQIKGRGESNPVYPLDAILRMAADRPLSRVSCKRRPIQLILDSDMQALPWESLPMLRDQELYRMPSLGTTYAVYIQRHSHIPCDVSSSLSAQFSRSLRVEETRSEAESMSAGSPSAEVGLDECMDLACVDPYNTYYILNPNGDLPSTQAAFENWFTQQPGWKGKAGIIPTAEEYQMGLRNHDLFVYLGHGSGDQFFPERYVRELDQCAASLLMGCSSGRLSFRGDYPPVGVVLSYLMAGCPAVIANLWDVTDGDIDRFSRYLLHSWLGSRTEIESGKEAIEEDSTAASGKCHSSTGGSGENKSTRRVVRGSKQAQKEAIVPDELQETRRLGSAVGQSRNACRLPHLIGASPVCYGVPTSVSKQRFVQTSS